MHANRSVSTHQFAMIPRADIPRASFRMQTAHKTTFDAGYLVPILCEEVLPGDSVHCSLTAFVRMTTPIYPVMDNLHLESFFFFVPNRLLWDNWRKFMGEQVNPGDSISYIVPTITAPINGFDPASIYDYFGLPTVGQVTAGQGGNIKVNALPLRAYNQIFNEWFRDENLVTSRPKNTGAGPDAVADYSLQRRGKRHDYFTSALPFVQKGASVPLPLGTSAPVKTSGSNQATGALPPLDWRMTTDGTRPTGGTLIGVQSGSTGYTQIGTNTISSPGNLLYPANLYADLSAATAATINQIRQSFQIQKLLERDARGGTRYTEIVRSHFGVVSPDARLQRPEYIGGGYTPVNINAVAQTQSTATGTTPMGTLAAFGLAVGHGHRFQCSATEHGYIIGLVNVRADLTYQQGLRKLWSRSTRYDFYFPAFAMLGEQAILTRELYCTGDAADDNVFGYIPRWDEYRHSPAKITGLFRSTTAGTLDGWHLAQRFTAVPTLNATFISETPPVSRVLAVGPAADSAQFYADLFFDMKWARPLPIHSVPGLVDHF